MKTTMKRGRTALKDGPRRTDVHVGNQIRIARVAAHMSQTELGDALGISFQQIQKYEKGSNRVSASRLWDLVHILKQDITFFFEGLEDNVEQRPLEPSIEKTSIKIARSINELKDPTLQHNLLSLVRSMVNHQNQGV